MTREEKIELLEFVRQGLIINARVKSDYDIVEALGAAISALKRPPREQAEKVWRGEWTTDGVCSRCGFDAMYYKGVPVQVRTNYCPNCGSPMTNEAVDMVMERLEALRDE